MGIRGFETSDISREGLKRVKAEGRVKAVAQSEAEVGR
jgi:hypothetical protein